jgi:hypothetical protein
VVRNLGRVRVHCVGGRLRGGISTTVVWQMTAQRSIPARLSSLLTTPRTGDALGAGKTLATGRVRIDTCWAFENRNGFAKAAVDVRRQTDWRII